jgi:riboflavin kinase / FMN adenylyltransferase
MRILRGLTSLPAELRPSAVALGAFDGIHLAHARILRVTVERARSARLTAVACTFDPHPAVVLRPDRVAPPIATSAENLARMAEQGLDVAFVIPFTTEFSRIEAEDFVADVLVGRLGAREVVVGFNHTFGRGARGTAALLQELGIRHGFTTQVLPPLQVDGQTVSSSAIREALSEGDVLRARQFLGRPYSISGTVLRGAGRGRQLGVPTANLRPEHPLLLAAGVYVCRVTWEGGGAGGVVNVGYRPTFGESEYWVEVHLLDFSGDLYDRVITIRFLERLRGEMRFPSVDALAAQIRMDIEAARKVLEARS